MIFSFYGTFCMTFSRKTRFFSFSMHPTCRAYTLMIITILVSRANLTVLIWTLFLITFKTFINIALYNIILTPFLPLVFSMHKILYLFPIFFLSPFYFVSYTHAIFILLFLSVLPTPYFYLSLIPPSDVPLIGFEAPLILKHGAGGLTLPPLEEFDRSVHITGNTATASGTWLVPNAMSLLPKRSILPFCCPHVHPRLDKPSLFLRKLSIKILIKILHRLSIWINLFVKLKNCFT